ncbi:MAG: Fur family transcriptional regulator [Bacteroidota bacterium]
MRSTPFRIALVQALEQSTIALTQAQLAKKLGTGTDRVTLYRNLRSLMQAGILHEINAGTPNPCYALCPPSCGSQEHRHHHVHFLCSNCGVTQCVDTQEPVWPTLPQGYQVQTWNLIAEGRCLACGSPS